MLAASVPVPGRFHPLLFKIAFWAWYGSFGVSMGIAATVLFGPLWTLAWLLFFFTPLWYRFWREHHGYQGDSVDFRNQQKRIDWWVREVKRHES